MEATVQMNTRLSRSLKEQGDAVLARKGFTPSQAVRALWSYACNHQDVPPFMAETQADASSEEKLRKLALIEKNVGLAITVAQQCGYKGPTRNLLGGKTWREIRDEMYDEMLDEMEG